MQQVHRVVTEQEIVQGAQQGESCHLSAVSIGIGGRPGENREHTLRIEGRSQQPMRTAHPSVEQTDGGGPRVRVHDSIHEVIGVLVLLVSVEVFNGVNERRLTNLGHGYSTERQALQLVPLGVKPHNMAVVEAK